VEVRLHPDDIEALTLAAPARQRAPDARPSLSRGDLRVHAETVRIDGTLDARLRGALEPCCMPAPSRRPAMSAQPEQRWLDARNLHLAARLGRIRPSIRTAGWCAKASCAAPSA
jgi:hypothetical protein